MSSRTRQTVIGLAIAVGIFAAWTALHVYGIFFIDLGTEPLWSAGLLILAQAWLSTGLFITAHDAMHGSLAPRLPQVQERVGQAALMIYAGLDYDRMKPAHYRHHSHVGTADDPDFHAERPRDFAPWLLRFFTRYYTHGQLARITVAATLYLLLGAHLLNIVVFWAVPALLALLQLFTFGTYLPHRHSETGFADRHRARSTAQPTWLSLLSCFHFGGFHHEHHLYPGEPWWRLPTRRLGGRAQDSAGTGTAGALAKARVMSASARPNSSSE
ncbi:MAG: fatty acid desaturase [Pacificimonas sp.]|nr:fatty acid desaturase [Pacificimonas sp.]